MKVFRVSTHNGTFIMRTHVVVEDSEDIPKVLELLEEEYPELDWDEGGVEEIKSSCILGIGAVP